MPDCSNPASTSLASHPLCLDHFISACYEKTDEFQERLRNRPFPEETADAMWLFTADCSRQAADLIQHPEHLNNLERARLLDILLTVADIRQRLRRSPRKVASVPVRLRGEELGRTWEEETQTRVVSRDGALLECVHPIEAGKTLLLVRTDTGQQARARVAWRQAQKDGSQKVGIELLEYDNFWGLEWEIPEPASHGLRG